MLDGVFKCLTLFVDNLYRNIRKSYNPIKHNWLHFWHLESKPDQ